MKKTKKEMIRKKRKALNRVISTLAVTANTEFNSPEDKEEWDLLLRFRDKLERHIEKKFPY